MKFRKWIVLDTYIVQDKYEIEACSRIGAIKQIKNTANNFDFSQQVIGRRKLKARLAKNNSGVSK